MAKVRGRSARKNGKKLYKFVVICELSMPFGLQKYKKSWLRKKSPGPLFFQEVIARHIFS